MNKAIMAMAVAVTLVAAPAAATAQQRPAAEQGLSTLAVQPHLWGRATVVHRPSGEVVGSLGYFKADLDRLALATDSSAHYARAFEQNYRLGRALTVAGGATVVGLLANWVLGGEGGLSVGEAVAYAGGMGTAALGVQRLRVSRQLVGRTGYGERAD